MSAAAGVPTIAKNAAQLAPVAIAMAIRDAGSRPRRASTMPATEPPISDSAMPTKAPVAARFHDHRNARPALESVTAPRYLEPPVKRQTDPDVDPQR